MLVCGRLRRIARCFTAFIIIINNNSRESTNISARCDRITALVMTPVLPDRTVRSVSSPASIRNRTMLLADTVLLLLPTSATTRNRTVTSLPMTLTLPSADFVRRRLTAWRTSRPAAQTRTLVGGANERIGLPALSASKA